MKVLILKGPVLFSKQIIYMIFVTEHVLFGIYVGPKL